MWWGGDIFGRRKKSKTLSSRHERSGRDHNDSIFARIQAIDPPERVVRPRASKYFENGCEWLNRLPMDNG
jgi:hypothetical protein